MNTKFAFKVMKAREQIECDCCGKLFQPDWSDEGCRLRYKDREWRRLDPGYRAQFKCSHCGAWSESEIKDGGGIE